VVVPDHGVVPLARDYLVRDADGNKLGGVRLRSPQEASGDTPPGTGPILLLGEGGMLFDAADPASFARERGVDALSGDEVARAARRVSGTARHLSAMGCAPAVVLVPAKLQVYPERLPPGLVALPATTPCTQLAGALRDGGDVAVIDLRPALAGSRHLGKMFLRSRPTLTWLGAFHAARATVEALAEATSAVVPRRDFAFRLGHPRKLAAEPVDAEVWLGGRLVPISLRGGLAMVPESDVEVDFDTLSSVEAKPSPGTDERAFTCAEAQTESALVISDVARDPGRLERMLAEHFRRTRTRRSPAPLDQLDQLGGADAHTATIMLLDDDAVARIARG
jgi:hypothetical protein